MNIPQNVSEAVKRRNPHLYPAMGGMVPNRTKQAAIPSLERRLQKPARRKGSVVVRVTIVAYRRALLDEHDNLAYSFKPLTDAIAESIGLDDKDSRIQWQFGQVKTKGQTGCTVMIETNQ